MFKKTERGFVPIKENYTIRDVVKYSVDHFIPIDSLIKDEEVRNEMIEKHQIELEKSGKYTDNLLIELLLKKKETIKECAEAMDVDSNLLYRYTRYTRPISTLSTPSFMKLAKFLKYKPNKLYKELMYDYYLIAEKE